MACSICASKCGPLRGQFPFKVPRPIREQLAWPGRVGEGGGGAVGAALGAGVGCAGVFGVSSPPQAARNETSAEGG